MAYFRALPRNYVFKTSQRILLLRPHSATGQSQWIRSPASLGRCGGRCGLCGCNSILSPTLQGRGRQGLGLDDISEPDPGPESWLTKGKEEALSRTDKRQVHIRAASLSSEGAQLAHPELAVTQQNDLCHSEPGPGARDAAGT